MKKIMVILLAAALVFACAVSASAAGLADLDCTGWWTAHSEGVEITETGVTITFTNTTYADAVNNWNGPLYVLYTGDEAKVNGAGYVEYWVQRTDNFGWAGALNTNDLIALQAAGISYSCVCSDWAGFLSALKAGTACTVTAIRKGDTVTVNMSVAGAVSTLTIPVTAGKPAYISLTGELTKLTNIQVQEGVVPVGGLTKTLNCSGWWECHTEGIEVDTDGVEITFTNTSYENASDNYHGPLWVLYAGGTNRVRQSTEYSEYWVQRADGYGWAGDLNTGNTDALAAAGISYTAAFAEGFNWDNYLPALKAGAACKITAVRSGDKVTVTTEVAGVTTTVEIPVASGKPAYLSLTGERTTLSNISAKSLAPEVIPDPDNPKQGDTPVSVWCALMAVSAAALVVLKKKAR